MECVFGVFGSLVVFGNGIRGSWAGLERDGRLVKLAAVSATSSWLAARGFSVTLFSLGVSTV